MTAANGKLAYAPTIRHVSVYKDIKEGQSVVCFYCGSLLLPNGTVEDSEKLQMAKLQRELKQ